MIKSRDVYWTIVITSVGILFHFFNCLNQSIDERLTGKWTIVSSIGFIEPNSSRKTTDKLKGGWLKFSDDFSEVVDDEGNVKQMSVGSGSLFRHISFEDATSVKSKGIYMVDGDTLLLLFHEGDKFPKTFCIDGLQSTGGLLIACKKIVADDEESEGKASEMKNNKCSDKK